MVMRMREQVKRSKNWLMSVGTPVSRKNVQGIGVPDVALAQGSAHAVLGGQEDVMLKTQFRV